MGKTLKYILTLVLIYFVYICLNSHVLAGFDYIEINPHTGVPDATIDVTPLEISSMTVVNITAPSGYGKVTISTNVKINSVLLSDNEIHLKPSGDASHYLKLKTVDSKPAVQTMGWSNLFIESDYPDSTGIRIYEDDSTYLTLAVDHSNSKSQITAPAEIEFFVNGDMDDYLYFQTISNIPEITTNWDCDLKITASGGDIDFDDENLATTGELSVSTITAPSGVNLTFIDDNAGTLTLSEMSCPPLIYISSASVSEGNINLADATNWDTSKALIKTVELLTAATDYTCVLYSDDGFSTDEVEVMVSGHEDSSIFLDYPYYDVDVSSEVHFKYTDNGGTATATIKMRGYKLR